MTHADVLRALHRPGDPLVLPNAWDAASARLVVEAGFPVVATSSGAVSASLGFPDDDTMPPDEAFAAIARIARVVDVPVTADVEAGYRLAPAELARRLLAAGASGCNVEDTDHHGPGTLVDPEANAERLAEVRDAAGSALVVNARVDSFLRSPDHRAVFDDGVERGRLYREAGADCLYPITLADEAMIGEYVQRVAAPVNVMFRPDGPSLARLAKLDVARVSYAGSLFRAGMAALRERLAAITPAR